MTGDGNGTGSIRRQPMFPEYERKEDPEKKAEETGHMRGWEVVENPQEEMDREIAELEGAYVFVGYPVEKIKHELSIIDPGSTRDENVQKSSGRVLSAIINFVRSFLGYGEVSNELRSGQLAMVTVNDRINELKAQRESLIKERKHLGRDFKASRAMRGDVKRLREGMKPGQKLDEIDRQLDINEKLQRGFIQIQERVGRLLNLTEDDSGKMKPEELNREIIGANKLLRQVDKFYNFRQSDIRQKIAVYDNKLQKLDSKLEKLNDKKASLEEQNKKNNVKIDKLSNKINLLEQKNQDYENEIKTKETEAQSKKDGDDGLVYINFEQANAIKKMQDNIKANEEKISEHEKEIEKTKKEIIVKNLENCDKLNLSISQLGIRKEKLTELKSEESKKLEKADVLLQEERDTVTQELQGQLNNLQKERDVQAQIAIEEMTKAYDKLENIENRRNALNKYFNDWLDKKRYLLTELDKFDKDYEIVQENLILQPDNEKFKNQERSLYGILSEYENEIEKNEKKINEFKNDFNKNKKDIEANRENALEELKEAQNEALVLTKPLTSKEQFVVKEKVKQEIEELTTSRNKIEKEIKEKRSVVAKMSEYKKLLEKEINQLKTKYAKTIEQYENKRKNGSDSNTKLKWSELIKEQEGKLKERVHIRLDLIKGYEKMVDSYNKDFGKRIKDVEVSIKFREKELKELEKPLPL